MVTSGNEEPDLEQMKRANMTDSPDNTGTITKETVPDNRLLPSSTVTSEVAKTISEGNIPTQHECVIKVYTAYLYYGFGL